MSKAQELRAKLIRNIHEGEVTHFTQGERYESRYRPLSDGTVASKLGFAFDVVPPGKRICPYHFHYAQEELFIIIEGEGTLRVAGEMLPVKAGDVITIPAGPEYPHHLINTSKADLKYFSISTKEYPEVCEYPDSGKYAAFSNIKNGPLLQGSRIHRAEQHLDYWDGEDQS
jgi:uncharacterized cupin superfamily protein